MAGDEWLSPFGRVPKEPPEGQTVIATALQHASVRAFPPDSLPESTLALLCEVMRRAPTSSALQTSTFVLVTDPEVRRELRSHAGGQALVESAPVFIVGCADLRRLDHGVDSRGYTDRSGKLRLLITATEDIAIALQNASLAAQSLGLGTVMVGGVLNGAREIAEILGFPKRVLPLLGLAIGHPAEPPKGVRPRLPRPVIFHRDRYTIDPDQEAELIARHDHDVIAERFYAGRRISWRDVGGEGADPIAEDAYGWTEHTARKQARLWWNEATPKLWSDLEALGWEF